MSTSTTNNNPFLTKKRPLSPSQSPPPATQAATNNNQQRLSPTLAFKRLRVTYEQQEHPRNNDLPCRGSYYDSVVQQHAGQEVNEVQQQQHPPLVAPSLPVAPRGHDPWSSSCSSSSLWTAANPAVLMPPQNHHNHDHHQPPALYLEDAAACVTADDDAATAATTQTAGTSSGSFISGDDYFNYRPVNNLLGELHRQRQLRLQHPHSSSLATTSTAANSSNSNGIDAAACTYQTPPKRPRQVVQLHTDSKLG